MPAAAQARVVLQQSPAPLGVPSRVGAAGDGQQQARDLAQQVVLEGEAVQPMEDFKDPKQEWRRLFSELLGTFFLVLVAAGGWMMG